MESEFVESELCAVPLPLLVFSVVVVPSWVVRVVVVWLFLSWVGQETSSDPEVGTTGSWPSCDAGGRLAAAPLLSVASKHTEPGVIDEGHATWRSICAGRTRGVVEVRLPGVV